MKKVLAFLLALSLALGLCASACAEGVNVFQFFSVYYWSLGINSANTGFPTMDITKVNMSEYDFYTAYELIVRTDSATDEVIEITIHPEVKAEIAFTAALGILLPFHRLTMQTALGTWKENVYRIGDEVTAVLDGGSFEEEGYVFHMLDDGAFYITEKNCYDRYYNQQAD